MRAFLAARFRTYRGFDFSAAVITHPDSDHCHGFLDLFADPRIGFKTVHHNGLVERPVAGTWEKIGAPQPDPVTGISYIRELAVDRAAVQAEFAGLPPDSRFGFTGVTKAALDNPKIKDVRMLSTAHAQMVQGVPWMPGFGPSDGRG